MLSLPFIVFWLLLYLNRKELGIKWIVILIGIWIGLLAGLAYLAISPYIFIIAESLIDIILILVLLGGDIRIR